jgi:hypothetical protein
MVVRFPYSAHCHRLAANAGFIIALLVVFYDSAQFFGALFRFQMATAVQRPPVASTQVCTSLLNAEFWRAVTIELKNSCG